jgi:hypothetical protein
LETIAVYWEPLIKTYGLMEKTGLDLWQLALPVPGQWDGGTCPADWETTGAGFMLASGQRIDGRTLWVNLVCEHDATGRMRAQLDQRFPPETRTRLSVIRPVEMITFHGPHFGDRYGIAGLALEALTEQDVPVLVMVCTAASVTLVLPAGKIGAARAGLSRSFLAPDPGERKSAS